MKPSDVYDSYRMPVIPDIENIEGIARRLSVVDTIWATGLGKSALVAHKFVGTCRSLGVRAHFIHPVDGLHGDSGAINVSDCLVAASASGETREVVEFASYARDRMVHPVVAVSDQWPNSLARIAHYHIRTTDPGYDAGMIPSASFISACCVLDMLAVAIAGEDARMEHPGGSIGRKITGPVQ